MTERSTTLELRKGVSRINGAYGCKDSSFVPEKSGAPTPFAAVVKSGCPFGHSTPKVDQQQHTIEVIRAIWAMVEQWRAPEILRVMNTLSARFYGPPNAGMKRVSLSHLDISETRYSVFNVLEELRDGFIRILASGAYTHFWELPDLREQLKALAERKGRPLGPDDLPEMENLLRHLDAFKYYDNTQGGSNEGLDHIGMVLECILREFFAKHQTYPTPTVVRHLMEEEWPFIREITLLHTSPNKILDLLIADGINPYCLTEEWENGDSTLHLNLRPEILRVVERFGTDLFTQPIEATPDGDQRRFTMIQELLDEEGADGETVQKKRPFRRRMAEVCQETRVLALKILKATDISSPSREQMEDALYQVVRLKLKELRVAKGVSLVDSRAYLGLAIMQAHNDHQRDSTSKETVGCPARYSDVLRKWHHYFLELFYKWYEMEYARLNSSGGVEGT